jgi:DNA polymerase elongation subunit (family B)
MLISGILIDLWHRPSRDGAPGTYMLWVRTDKGVICLEDREFRPSFTIIPKNNAPLVEAASSQHFNVSRTEMGMRRASIYSEAPSPAIRAFMVDERKAEETMADIRRRSPSEVAFAEHKIREDLQWHYLRRIPPHSRVRIEEQNGCVKAIQQEGPPEPAMMKLIAISPSFTGNTTSSYRLSSISLHMDGMERRITGDEASILRGLQAALDNDDPDIVALFDADNHNLPLLGLRSRACGIGLRMGRVQYATPLYEANHEKEGIKHWRASQVRAPGRVIMDLWKDARTDADLKRTDLSLYAIYRAEFGDKAAYSEASMVYGLARERLPMFLSWCERCMMPIDSVCREKHGFMNSSMVNYELIGTTVIPEEAEYPGGFKTPIVEELKENGGLVITPEAGLHEEVAIVDFSSLFPRIFVKHNISPETINCKHPECRENGEKVPFLGFHICMKRRGVYPVVFGRVLEERDRVKLLMSSTSDSEERRKLEVLYRSLKMQLVSPYGYMQFHLNNFRTVDGNRSVPAFGRWYLLRARDMAEDAGFKVIYADTDSLFIQRKGAEKEAYAGFCSYVSKELGMELKLEHVCRWVLFLPERQGGSKGLKKKYFASEDGEPLVRGFEVRRQDRPGIAKQVQNKAMIMLASAKNAEEFRAMIPQVVSYVRSEVSRISGNMLAPEDLTIIKKLSKRPEEYKGRAHHCIAADRLAGSGQSVRVGGKIEYIVTGKNNAIPYRLATGGTCYDTGSYVDNTVRPIYMLLREFGVCYEDLMPGPKQTKLDMYEAKAEKCKV